jgi:hypothetical protein
MVCAFNDLGFAIAFRAKNEHADEMAVADAADQFQCAVELRCNQGFFKPDNHNVGSSKGSGLVGGSAIDYVAACRRYVTVATCRSDQPYTGTCFRLAKSVGVLRRWSDTVEIGKPHLGLRMAEASGAERP